MKSCLKYAGLGAVLATASQAEVKINENFSFDGYAIGAGVVTEGTASKNGPEFGKSGSVYDSVYIALNGKYNDFSGKVSLFAVNPFDGAQSAQRVDALGAPILDTNGDAIFDPIDNVGVLDAYVTYKVGDLAITGGKYLGWLGFESFHSPNNAFISYGLSNYASPWATGAKVDYSGEGFSTGISVRDSQIVGGEGFFEGDGEFANDIGYEAYFLYTGVEKLTLFFGAGFEDVDDEDIGGILTTNVWASYAVSEKVSVAAEYANVEDNSKNSWLLQTSYAVSEAVSVAGRLTGFDGDKGVADGFGYGLASTYTISPNFSVKGEVTTTDFNSGESDVFSYAIQGLFRF
jgi:hypothetical protein